MALVEEVTPLTHFVLPCRQLASAFDYSCGNPAFRHNGQFTFME
ncbi:hypothetical protein HMPREF1604_00375 [Escherichia coli 908519]|uniref:Uncharacterized protein n=1 Tax=Escherichia coli TaxID=562 RepID=A0A7U0Q665_ECOLX|nr:hypothetical protein HMPREF1604_00375 [Escherichia coli 908519]QQW38290.1 hypothetical protein [Escherichia coli]QRN76132.1 hypothetical protein [Escherichia coli]